MSDAIFGFLLGVFLCAFILFNDFRDIAVKQRCAHYNTAGELVWNDEVKP